MTATEAHDEAVQALVPASVAGDRRALQQLINLIHPPVVRYCRARMGAQKYPTPDDVAQEVCLAVARSIETYEEKGVPFMAFVYRIAAHKVVDGLRAQSRDHSNPVEEVPDEAIADGTPESEILLRDSCNEISQLFDLLSDNAKDVLTLRIFEGYSAEETAEILGMTAGAVRVAQFRALAKLRKHLESEQQQAHVS